MMNLLATLMLPQSESNLGKDTDQAWNIILITTTIFFFIVVGTMFYFIIKYRRKTPNDVTSPITHNTPIEIIWTVVPLIIVLIFFYQGFKGFLNYDNPPSNCVAIGAQASQWQFLFTYPNGAQDKNLYLLVNQPVRIDMTSADVLHALYIPEFRTQRNFVPGRLTNIWFIPTEVNAREAPDGWAVFCTQYCGDGHSRMFSHVFVLAQAEYDAKMKELADPFKKKDPATGKSHYVAYKDLGETLYHQLGCVSCHSIEPTETIGTGPPWHGLYKRDHDFAFIAPDSVLNTEGKKGVLDAQEPDQKWDDYLKESMLKPDAALVHYPKGSSGKDFHGMPSSFASVLGGSVSNNEKERALATFIKTLGNTGWKPDISPETEPKLYDADNPVLFDENKNPVHPESLAGIKARAALTQPATTP